MVTTRRHFLLNAWKTCAALLATAATWTSWELLKPLSASGATGKLRLREPSNYAPGTATYVREGRLWLVNANGHLRALSQKCPHLGCRVPFCESSGRFECPCHGSEFDIGGEWIKGPSPRGMDQHPLAIDGGVLVVDTSKRIDGPDHGASQFAAPAKGPSCAGKG